MPSPDQRPEIIRKRQIDDKKENRHGKQNSNMLSTKTYIENDHTNPNQSGCNFQMRQKIYNIVKSKLNWR